MTRIFDDLLRKTLPEPRLDLIRRVADEAAALKMPLYIVGGLVRDLLLGRDGLDFDLVVEGDAIMLAHSLVSKYGGSVTAHEKFGTAKIDIRGWRRESGKANEDHSPVSIDLISSRSETYKHPAALPTVKMSDMTDDLRRRDFTINTLAIRLDGSHFGEMRDDLGGLDDLENKIIRVLYERSFIDDPTRMYRAVRYEQRYGFKVANETLKLIPEARGQIDKLSAQRIRHELDLILEEPNAALMLARLADLDLLKPIHAALSFDESARQRLDKAKFSPDFSVQHLTPANLRWLLWLMNLSEKQIESVNKRLHFTSILINSLISASNLPASLSSFPDLKPSQCVEQLDEIPALSIYAVSLATLDEKSKEKLEKYLAEWRRVKPKTTGYELKKLGLEPGPRYQEVLSRLRAAWLDETTFSEKDEEDLLKQLLDRTKR